MATETSSGSKYPLFDALANAVTIRTADVVVNVRPSTVFAENAELEFEAVVACVE
jgi:hypothetical protein